MEVAVKNIYVSLNTSIVKIFNICKRLVIESLSVSNERVCGRKPPIVCFT